MWWIWPIYITLLILMTFLSIVIARFVDALDKKSNISGGLLGGILLAGVTSLPELITSLSAILLLSNADMTFGNIVGSNFFDVVIIGTCMLCMFFIIKKCGLSKNTGILMILTFVATAIILVFNVFNLNWVIPGVNIHALSLIFVGLYVFVIISSRKQDDIQQVEELKKETRISKMSVKQIALWFVLCAIFLIAVSVGITYATDFIAETYNIGSSVAGAVFLGVATSLPEVITCFELVRLKNYNMAVNDIYGSVMFNLLILTIADIFYFKGTIFSFNIQTLYMISFMLGVIVLSYIAYLLKRKNTKLGNSGAFYLVTGGVITISYFLCMILCVV